MATNKAYNLSDIRMITQRYRSVSGTETFCIRVYQGSALVNINLDKNPKPIFNRHWKLNVIFQIVEFMKEFVKSEPNTDKTLVFNAYNRVEKKKNLDYVLIFRKDERKIYHIIVKSNGQTYDFPVRGPQDIAFGTGEIPEDVKSLIEWKSLIHFLSEFVPLQMQLSSFPIEPPAGGFQRGGQGGYNNGGYNRGNGQQGGDGGGYTPRPNANGEFSSSRGLPSDEDMFE